ncbi:hypothetical protein SASPL_132441 [Salvia splendens]|uniref:Myb proto-oncogene protein, plant n=1 Tax=Salvia splendens TaxID=180675 RepID=A0A8X8ZI73_SALSN|nr:hypothetical protein SASPL_132441 [Salvia splendens]
MGRSPCCDKNGLKNGPWTPEEDEKLSRYIHAHGAGNWRNLPKNAGLERCGKSCRLRWINYLRPDIKRGRFSFEEEETIIQLHSVLGNKWSAIAEHLPRRTDNEIKKLLEHPRPEASAPDGDRPSDPRAAARHARPLVAPHLAAAQPDEPRPPPDAPKSGGAEACHEPSIEPRRRRSAPTKSATGGAPT